MEIAQHLWKTENFIGDAPEYFGTPLGHGVTLLDAFAQFSHCASDSVAYQVANQEMIQIHGALLTTGAVEGHEVFKEVNQSTVDRVIALSKQHLGMWWNDHSSVSQKNSVPKELSLRYEMHSKVMSIAVQRSIKKEHFNSIQRIPAMEFVLKHIIENKMPDHDDAMVRDYLMNYSQLQLSARLMSDIWRLRRWESSQISGIASSGAELGGFELHRFDKASLKMPLHILIHPDEGLNYDQLSLADAMSQEPYYPIIEFIQKHDTVFARRNTSLRVLRRAMLYMAQSDV